MFEPHVFVTCADLTHLACDALVVPTDTRLHVSSGWTTLEKPTAVPDAFRAGSQRAFVDPTIRSSDPRIRVWTNLGADQGEHLQWFIDGACEAVTVAAMRLGKRPFDGSGRAHPLIGVPLVGTGLGGGRRYTADIVRRLLPALREAARVSEVDVCLTLRHERTYAAVQSVRAPESESTFVEHLGEDLVAQGQRLAALARDGNLVLFIGAGGSMGGGLQNWDGLLHELASRADFTDAEREQLPHMDELDRARIIQMRLDRKDEQPLGEVVRSLIAAKELRPLPQTLLASLPVKQVATTNYDQLFETSSQDIGQPCAILPYAPSADQRRFLLKLHGCITRPLEIVLTRDDYLRFSSTRAALAGIVQALMVTRHMLFVGFSLRDDNFHRILHDVRRTMPTTLPGDGVFGTALLLGSDTLTRELWKRDVTIVPTQRAGEEKPLAARRLAILLDYVGMHAAGGTAHLLDPQFEGLLSEAEQQLADALQELQASLPAAVWRTPAGLRVKALLADLGAKDAPGNSEFGSPERVTM